MIDNWQNIYVYFSPPANYQVIGMVSGKGRGFSNQGRLENAFEGMKQEALDAGATGVLMQTAGVEQGGSVGVATWSNSGSGGFGVSQSIPIVHGSVSGLAIYVPEDAVNFTKAQQAHTSDCAKLATAKKDLEAALKTIQKNGAPADIDVAKQKLQSAEDAEDAAYCGKDDWYSRQMQAQQQLLNKMRAEDAANKANHDADCLTAAKNNDLEAWRKYGCK